VILSFVVLIEWVVGSNFKLRVTARPFSPSVGVLVAATIAIFKQNDSFILHVDATNTIDKHVPVTNLIIKKASKE